MKNPAHMWGYWRDKHGLAEAAEGYFPELFASDPVLNYALSSYKAAEFVINARMKQIEETEE